MNMNKAPGQGNQVPHTELTDEEALAIQYKKNLVEYKKERTEELGRLSAHLKKHGPPILNFKLGGERPDYVAGDEKYLVEPTVIQPYDNPGDNAPDFGDTNVSESTHNDLRGVLETPAYSSPGALYTPYKDLALSPEQTEFIELLSESIEEDNKFIAQKTISLKNALEKNTPESQQRARALQIELKARKELRNKKLLQKIGLIQDTTEFGDFYKQEYEGYLRDLAKQIQEDEEKIKKQAAKGDHKELESLSI